jgi:hypothetical protein
VVQILESRVRRKRRSDNGTRKHRPPSNGYRMASNMKIFEEYLLGPLSYQICMTETKPHQTSPRVATTVQTVQSFCVKLINRDSGESKIMDKSLGWSCTVAQARIIVLQDLQERTQKDPPWTINTKL